jgi:hypothetical protein
LGIFLASKKPLLLLEFSEDVYDLGIVLKLLPGLLVIIIEPLALNPNSIAN